MLVTVRMYLGIVITIHENVFQDLLTSAGTFWLFSGCCALNIVFTIIFVPETKGKTLEQIQARFKGTPEQLSYNRPT